MRLINMNKNIPDRPMSATTAFLRVFILLKLSKRASMNRNTKQNINEKTPIVTPKLHACESPFIGHLP